jgi:extracellular elastinolytic metalloproteinase
LLRTGRARVGRRGVLAIAVVLASALLALPAAASAVGRAVRAHVAAKPAAKPYFDSRVGARRAAVRSGRSVGSSTERTARSHLRARLGNQAVVQVDALTGTARSVQKLNGTLTGPAAGDRAAVAMRWLRTNRAALGLTAADVDALTLASRKVDPGSGFTYLRYRQSYRGIPAFDNGLNVNLDRAGRILNVTGSPVSNMTVPSVTPKVDAAAALRALQRNVDAVKAIDVESGPSGDRETTVFTSGDFARLVLFDGADGVRLAWHVVYQANTQALYDAVVDASTGAILLHQNLTKFDAAGTVFPNYPGAQNEAGGKGGPQNDPQPVNFETKGWLTGTETNLDGTFVHAFSDVNDDNAAQSAEEITRADASADYPSAFTDFAAPADETDACEFTDPYPNPPTPDWPDPIGRTADCSWNPKVANSWTANRSQNGVQAFYLANVFRDHLGAAPIGFGAADGDFEGVDKVQLNTDDGANKNGTGLPDAAHIDNANMSTPPNDDPAHHPTMQMYLFAFDEHPDAVFNFRNVNGGDDASTVWHEYTHGLSNRLITHADGTGAVSSPHAGAMGEAWSDWYALDFLHQRALENVDDPTVPGQVDVGVYADAVFGSTRFEPIDCKVTVDDDDLHCPGGFFTGSGGYTFGDFGKVAAILDANGDPVPFPEVHSDGEIWMQTLWDLRQALIDLPTLDDVTGSQAAEQLVTQAMRLSPPESSFLDMRNAILAADAGLPVHHRELIWQVFAHRGLGYFAGVADSSDSAPVEDFNMPPANGAAKGTVAGTVTSADTGLPLGGVSIGVGGLTTVTSPTAFPDRLPPTTSAANGHYALSVPAGTYGGLVFDRSGWDKVNLKSLHITAGATTARNVALRRDWASRRGGGVVTQTSDDTGADFGCGVAQLIDQNRGVGWSAFNPNSTDPDNPHHGAPTATIRLPQTIDVTAFGLDPSNTCGDDPSAQTKGYSIQTSADGVHFATAKQGSFTPDNNGRLNIVAPSANSRGVRYVRLTLLSPQSAAPGNSGADFIDFSELEVFGGPRNVLPSGTLQVSPAPANPGQTVTLRAQFGDPDSKITGYGWDFDGNGTIDRRTSAAATTFAYANGGDYGPRVSAFDFRGGAGTATRLVHVTTDPIVGPLPKTGRKGSVKFRVSCELSCRVTARLKVSKKIRKALRLKSRTVGTLKKSLAAGTSKRLTVKLSRKAKRALERHHVKKVKTTLSVKASYSDGRLATAHRSVTIRR